MATPVETVAQDFLTLGVYDIVLFALFAALFYGFLRKTKLLGDSPILIGVISLSIAFLIFGFPVITGSGSILFNVTTFFTQAAVFALVFLVAFLIAGMFYPNMTETLSKVFTHRSTLYAMLALGFVLFLTSGLIQVILQGFSGAPEGSIGADAPAVPQNILLFVAGIFIFIMMIVIASATVRSSG